MVKTVKDFEAASLHADLEVIMEVGFNSPAEFSYNQAGWQWEFAVAGWKNLTCSSAGNRKSDPKWRVPNWKLAGWLEQQVEGWFYCLSERQMDEFMEG